MPNWNLLPQREVKPGMSCIPGIKAGLGVLALLLGSTAVSPADEATATLRREQREEAQALREQQAQDDLAPDAGGEQGRRPETQTRERATQDALHARQLREQLQSSQIRQLGQQAPGQAAAQGQIQLQQFRREREAQRLQNELLRPPASAPRH